MILDPTTEREAAEQRRERLRTLMDRLEAALAEPPKRDIERWRTGLLGLAGEFAVEIEDHVGSTEGPGGMFDQVLAKSPRLANQVERQRAEHPALTAGVEQLTRAVDHGHLDEGGIRVARSAGLDLLTKLIVHRQHGADLLYEAYWVDVGEYGD